MQCSYTLPEADGQKCVPCCLPSLGIFSKWIKHSVTTVTILAFITNKGLKNDSIIDFCHHEIEMEKQFGGSHEIYLSKALYHLIFHSCSSIANHKAAIILPSYYFQFQFRSTTRIRLWTLDLLTPDSSITSQPSRGSRTRHTPHATRHTPYVIRSESKARASARQKNWGKCVAS